jgi:hypothetical protein
MLLTPKTVTDVDRGGSWNASLFMWPFFLLMWNLMSRSDSVDTLMLSHIRWEGDSLQIQEQGHKGDQTGEFKFWKHLYANPSKPEVCVVLALAVLVFSTARPDDGSTLLFAGSNSKDRFCHLLQEVVGMLNEADQITLGCRKEDVGSHSGRKGSSTYALGQVNGPSPVAVFLRMGQSLGQLKDRYIFAADGQDQLCGRMLAMLDFNSETFGTLPPHFTDDVAPLLTEQYWESIVSGYKNYPASFRSCFPFLLARLLYSENYLRSVLPPRHPLFTVARVFTHNEHLALLRGKVVTGIGMCKLTGMQCTGIPPHLAIAGRLAELTQQVAELRTHLTNQLTILENALPEKVAEATSRAIMDNFVIEGAQPLTMKAIEEKFANLQGILTTEMRALLAQLATNLSGSQQNTVALQLGAARPNDSSWWREWIWERGHDARRDSVLFNKHSIPDDWKFPDRITTKALWDLWLFGNKHEGIRPLFLIPRKSDLRQEDFMKHTRANKVMEVMDKIACDNGLLPEGTRTIRKLYVLYIPGAEMDSLFDKIFKLLINHLYPDSEPGPLPLRISETSYGTIYDKIVKSETTTKKGTIKKRLQV